MANQVYQIVTDRIVQLLETGTVPWRKPWVSPQAGPPRNLNSGRPYRGINVFLLGVSGFSSPYWVTFKQAKSRGGHVRKGEKSTPVIFWKQWETEDRATGEQKKVPVLRYYNCFNVEQCDGVEFPKADAPTHDWDPIAQCEGVVKAMPKRPSILERGNRACYMPLRDIVEMPPRTAFMAPEEFYSTLFHELTHSTGHPSRLDREGIRSLQPFGSADYSREELIAEMGAAFLAGHCGIEPATIENSAAYVAGWLRKLKGDPRLVVQAAGQAQKAADYILGTKWEGGGA